MIDQIARVFRISIYLLLGLSSATIGLAEGNLFPHLLTIPLIFLAYQYFDEHPPLKLESFFTSLLGIVALLVAMWEFQQGRIDIEMRILSASHLLAYFTWIVLILEKTTQQYWWLLALSILNMAVSASLTTAPALGLSALVFLFLAVWTLAIFTAYRGTAHLREGTFRGYRQKENASASGVFHPGGGVDPANSSSGHFVGNVSQVRGGFHFDPSDNWMGTRLIASVIYITAASIVVGLAIFLVTPRYWIGNWQLPSSENEEALPFDFGKSVSGFTKEVQLGDMGEILSNPTPVLYVTFEKVRGEIPITAEQAQQALKTDDLLFRGTTLTRYENGRWREGNNPSRSIPLRKAFLRPGNEYLRLSHELEPIGRNTLFTQHPLVYGRILSESISHDEMLFNPLSLETNLIPESKKQGLSTIRYETIAKISDKRSESGFAEYQVHPDQEHLSVIQRISDSIEEDYQNPSVNAFDERTVYRHHYSRFRRHDDYDPRMLDLYVRRLLVIDQENLSGLVELAENLCRSEEGEPPLAPVERVRKLHDYLKNSGEYGYTLDQTISNPELDPVEDFLLVRKKGHCEYFASAMTLMLRAVGVPARMVTGFRSGRWDESREQLIIEQRHAHAWVEALVDGKWLVVDPTTARSQDLLADSSSGSFSFAALRAEFSTLWQTYILGMSLTNQQRTFYEPLRQSARSMYESLRDSGRQLTQQVTPGAKTRYSIYNRLLMIAATVLPFLLIVFVVAFLLFRQRLRNFLEWLLPARHLSRRQQMMKFFQTFLQLAARQGLRKRPEQTALEFAREFQHRFGGELSRCSLNQFPLAITRAYYEARFRGDLLSNEEIQRWESQIDRLQQELKVSG